MAKRRFVLNATVSTNSPDKVRAALTDFLGDAAVRSGEKPAEFVVKREMEGESVKDLNRDLLSSLRRVERKTRLRAEWTAEDGTVYRFFDYVLKKESKPGSRMASGRTGAVG
jgi:hypothetical protein